MWVCRVIVRVCVCVYLRDCCQANLEDAAVLYAAAGVKCEDPIQVIFCSTAEHCAAGASDAAAAAYCCLLAYLEEGAALTLKQSFVSASLAGASETQLALPQSRTAASFVSANTRIHLAENSRLEHTLSQELSGERVKKLKRT